MVQHPTNPIPETLESVPGYPDHLKIYRIPASSYWYVRGSFNDKRVTRSLKTENHANAISAAKDFYKEMLVKLANKQPLTQSSEFKRVAEAMIDDDRSRVSRGERSATVVTDAEYILEKDLLPFFKKDQLKNIAYKRIQEYVEHLQKRSVSSGTVKKHFIQLSKILKHAHKMDLLDKLPIFPTVSVQDNPRDWLDETQYEVLQKAIRKAIKDKVVVRGVPLTEEMRELTNFMVNSFLRPQDIKILKNKDIRIVKKPNRTYLRIMAKGKTRPAPVISTQAAVTIYERIKGDPEAYVFFPKLLNRDYAMATMMRQFNHVLNAAGLKAGENGQARTLYSLRHTCIMKQLLGGWDHLVVAKNSRTSVDMITRFYASRLTAEMNVAGMVQQSEGGADLEDFFEDEAPPT
jgi:site-specific recombinase XerD